MALNCSILYSKGEMWGLSWMSCWFIISSNASSSRAMCPLHHSVAHTHALIPSTSYRDNSMDGMDFPFGYCCCIYFLPLQRINCTLPAPCHFIQDWVGCRSLSGLGSQLGDGRFARGVDVILYLWYIIALPHPILKEGRNVVATIDNDSDCARYVGDQLHQQQQQ